MGDPFNPYGGYARLLHSSGPSSRPQISFAMPDRNLVTLEMYDVRGMLVERRKLGLMNEGENDVSLFNGRRPSAGVYLYTLNVGSQSTTRRMIVLK